jgi:hypothetical protein
MSLSKKIDLSALGRMPAFAFYFRYPLSRDDFAELRIKHRLRGYYAAKPLYSRLTATGRVDRSSDFSGEIAVIFIPSPARSVKHSELLVAHMPKAEVTLSNGRRNWPAIRRAAKRAIASKCGELVGTR